MPEAHVYHSVLPGFKPTIFRLRVRLKRLYSWIHTRSFKCGLFTQYWIDFSVLTIEDINVWYLYLYRYPGTMLHSYYSYLYPQSFIRDLTLWTHTHTRTHGTRTHGPVPVPMYVYPSMVLYPDPYPWLCHMSYPYHTRTHGLVLVPVPVTHGLEPVSIPIPMASYPYPYPWSVPTLQVWIYCLVYKYENFKSIEV